MKADLQGKALTLWKLSLFHIWYCQNLLLLSEKIIIIIKI